MKKALLCLAFLPSVVAAQDPAGGRIRVLFTYGGHDFEQKPMYAMLDAMADIAYTKCELPREMDRLKPGLEKDFDVILRYDMVPKATPEQQQAFMDLMKTSGIGLVAMHHNMGAHPNWDDYKSIIGAKFIFKTCEIEGKAYSKSGWSHDQDLKIIVEDKTHPITQGVEDFTIRDETYNKYYVAPDVKLLLKTDHPKNDPQIAWVREFGKSRVFYCMLGHDHKAWEHPAYRKILIQGIRWAAKK
jgi:hypothetical protein